ncbi:Multi-sensor Signal Transduction Histidine Kinase [Nostoc sp. NIES-3756]|uniref:PAS domain S-box protein n=1 Tax=Nostoc sp. NIES-3756 TaxID=1751286 RepID=UPI000720F0DB|nr:PAS domain S-box protein [Nostoc sp. NIES-3756]BAT54619.1 Multi-sensor Signal Transduction Histidine Kinase [Nostoc sp. NIES-3756]
MWLSNMIRERQGNNKKLKISLRIVLTVPFVLLIGGTTALVSYVSWQNSQRSVNSLAYQLMSEMSDRIHLYLSNYLKTSHLINRLNVHASQLKQIDITNPQSLEPYFFGQIQQFGSKRIHFINPQGGLVGAGNDERGLTISFTKNFAKGELYVYSVDAQRKRQQLLVNEPNYDGTQRPFYQKAVSTGKPTWTPIYLYVPASRGLGIAAAYPVYNQKKQLLGVFASDIDLVTISKFLRKLQIGTHGKVFIMERSGLMVAASTPEPPFVTDAKGILNQRLMVREIKEPIIRHAGEYLLTRGNLNQIQTTQKLKFEIEGKKQYLLVIPYSDKLGLDWLIVTVVPESDFTAEIVANTRLTLIFSLAALAFAIALGLLLTEFIARPMQKLGQTSLALAEGEWHQPIEQESLITEFQVLGHSLNWMSQQLRQSYESVKIALQQSEERFTKVFRTCPEAMGIFTLNGQCIDVNEAFIDLYSCSREDIIGQTLTQFQSWINLDNRQSYLQDLLSGKQVRNQEFAVRDKTGKTLTVLVSADIIELQGQPHIIAVTKNISNRKLAELELLQQKDLRDSIYNESADALFLVDAQTLLITDCNLRAVELFEADSKCELIGIAGHTLQLRQFTTEELADIAAQIEHKGVWSAEIEYLTRKGNLFWGNLAAKEVAIASQVIHLVRVTDITERRQTEAALRHSEARFQKIAAASPAQIYILSYYPDTYEMRYEYISSGVREIQELEPQQVIENPLLTYEQVHPDDVALYNQLTTQSLKALEPFAHEWRIITPSGKTKWVRANSRPERRSNGEIAWYGVLLDITDLKQAEAALRESEERFRHAFYDAPIGMALLGLNQKWLQINPMLQEMLGYSKLEIFNFQAFEIIHPEDVPQLEDSITQVLNNENTRAQVQLRYVCNGGRIAWGLTSLSLVRDLHNQPLYYVLQIQDTTEQQAIEQMKNEFISIVSHELRTPLTAIQGFLALLNTGIYDNRPEKAKWMIQQALTNSDRLVRLVNDILDLERLSSGRVELVKEVCNAADLIQRAVEGVQSIALAAAITISITPTTARVWASPDLIIQTLTNLLSNAIKFSPRDSVITVLAQLQSDSVLFAVKDQGRGIPADKLETIFERFGQVDISDARAKGGTGLGLAICQNIIQQHDGSIWAESTLGKGSTFYFTLPIVISP